MSCLFVILLLKNGKTLIFCIVWLRLFVPSGFSLLVSCSVKCLDCISVLFCRFINKFLCGFNVPTIYSIEVFVVKVWSVGLVFDIFFVLWYITLSTEIVCDWPENTIVFIRGNLGVIFCINIMYTKLVYLTRFSYS